MAEKTTLKILIVEDEPVSAAVLSHMVHHYGVITVASNGREGFDSFCDASEKGEPFDIVFLDIMMPEIDGQEVLKAIREFENENSVPPENRVNVVMVTAVSDPENLYLAHRSSCQDYLTKPICKDKLVASLRRLGFEVP